MKRPNLKRALLPVILIGGLMTINGQVKQSIDHTSQLKTLSFTEREYAEVLLLVSTNTGESPGGAIATFEQIGGDSTYTDTVPESGTLTFPEVWVGEYNLTVTKEGYEPYTNVINIQGEYYIEEVLLLEELVPPDNLEAEANCKDVYLEWTHNPTVKTRRSENRKIPTQAGNNSRETNQREFIGFNVYKEGVLLNEEPLSETEYTDENSLGGTFGYCATAVYSTGESGSTDTVNVEVDFITPPDNLEGYKINWVDIQLEWDEPLPQQYYPLQWDDGENYTSIGTEDEYDFSVASRWYPEDLGVYDSMYLDKISFYPTEENCEYYA
ncbi:MAG: carboxypeptidase-like regulatory domain-containing protein, partial [Bacteroidales bacterium]|nr:carboxypeptidase-like regulatory domain-containing protein [Bacteroidales bacterium]MCF8334491.1 carboxypeptidase-like regulatory domain-containing protein [Bacteroidales bacterium]